MPKTPTSNSPKSTKSKASAVASPAKPVVSQSVAPKVSTTASRSPVVVVMGHIDHGKSTLLDYIRKTNVVDKEVGGITQRMSSYEIEHAGGRIVFIDTPGHESFGAIRARGATAADVAILVVSAEDGVKPQTIDAFRAITKAKLPYIVGISKIDKDNANIERTKQTLAENEIYVEGYGGSIPWVGFSGKTGEGVPELLDMLLLVADVEQFTADSAALAEGVVIESNRDKVRGISATIIVKNGSLKTGQYVTAGKAISPVRILENFLGKTITTAGPSTAVRIVGWSEEPEVGGKVHAFATRKEAEEYASLHVTAVAPVATPAQRPRTPNPSTPTPGSANTPGSPTVPKEEIQVAVLPVVIKADTSGAVEAVKYEVAKIAIDRVTIKIVGASMGDISENDVRLAAGKAGTVILGFNTKIDNGAKSIADRHQIDIQTFDIIYKLTEWLENEAKARVPKMEVLEEKGIVKVLKIFSVSRSKQVLGGRVETGVISLNDEVTIYRREAEIGKGHVRELQHLKAKVGTVEEGKEFGTMIESKIEIAPGDKLHAIHLVTK